MFIMGTIPPNKYVYNAGKTLKAKIEPGHLPLSSYYSCVEDNRTTLPTLV
jgi:hypothetical protein